MGYVYKINNTINGKAYIGISINEPEKGRIRLHLSGHGNRILSRAVKKYGRDAFIYEILEENVFPELLSDLEVHYISTYNTVVPNGYNLTYGGERAQIASEETKQKLSEAKKGENHHFYGKSLTFEHRRKIGEASKGRRQSVETKQKLSEAKKGNQNALGYKHSEEARRKISESKKGKPSWHKGKKRSVEARRKISEAKKGEKSPNFGKPAWNKGKKMSDEFCQKISEAQKGKKHSAETRRKMSKSQKGKPAHPNSLKNLRPPKYVSPETRRKISESKKGKSAWNKGKRKPIFKSACDFFYSLSADMPLLEKRKTMREKYSDLSRKTIWRWTKQWQSEQTS